LSKRCPPAFPLPLVEFACPSKSCRTYRPIASAIPLCGCAIEIMTIRHEVFRNDSRPRVASGPSLVSFGSPSEYDPNRLRRPLRIAAAFLSFCAPTAFSAANASGWNASQPYHLRRSTPLTVVHPLPEFRSLETPARGVHPAKLFPLNVFLAANAGGTRSVLRFTLRWAGVVSRLPFASCCANCFTLGATAGFRALLPLRIRQFHAGISRMKPAAPLGFCLFKVSFPAPGSPSRTFRPRTCPG
jgi:hypothetical protein